jgi:NADP-reducing hydrogenase subunit HndC
MTTATNILATPARFPHLLLPAILPADPTDLAAAVEAGAFTGLRATVEDLRPIGVIKAIAESGMLGRGGPGPGRSAGIGEKWRLCAATPSDQHYVVVNAYQSDPAVMTDRVLIETNPYAVLEGAAIAAFAIGATEVIVAIRADATDAIRVLETAIAAAEQAGYLGGSVLGTATEIHVSVKPLQGSYMLGEETVLLKGLEGKRGQPEQQPPYTTTRGLFGKPTLIHGPQTLAAVPTILNGGLPGFEETAPRAFAGTVLIQLSGAVLHPGVAEVPFGATLREIVDVAGGPPTGHKIKAVLVGGPSGGILPADALNVIFDHTNLEAAGAHLGSGSIVVIDQHTCVVDLAAVLTRFCADEACGKTIPCRIGLRRLAEIGTRFTDGQPRGDDVTRLLDLSHDIVESALCDHERRATLSLQSVVRYFRDELDAHIVRNSCPAGICHPKAETRAGAVS